ncbi:MAG: hypothetical protein AAFY16_07985 [Cyanobacteria bacterium J06642_3]
MTNGGRVAADTFGKGDAGAIKVSAMGDITVDGEDSQGFKSGLTSIVNQGAKGDGGDITISVNDLNLNNGGRVSTISFSQGDSGNIFIQADENISLSNGNIVSLINPGGMGTAGNIDIETNSLSLKEGGQIQSGLFRTDEGLPGGQGLGGNITITSKDYIDISGLDSDSFSSSIITITEQGASGDAGDVILNTGKLLLSDSGNINSATRNSSNAGDIIINASSFEATSGGQIRATTARSSGNAGNITLNIDGSIDISGSDPTFNQRLEQFGEDFVSDAGAESGLFVNATANSTGQAGSLLLSAEQLNLSQQGTISASTQVGNGGNVSLMISKDISLKNNSTISARAFGEANGGNLDIDARFIVAFPNQIDGNGSDIIANAGEGNGGNIAISAESLFGMDERDATLNNQTNDIDASSEFGLDGSISIFTPDINPVQRAAELPNNIVEPQQTTTQACETNREAQAKNGLNIRGKGGVPADPGLPFDSQNISINGKYSNPISTIPQPLETSQGKIQPARGIKVTEDGGIVLTAYRTNNAGERLAEGSLNCS